MTAKMSKNKEPRKASSGERREALLRSRFEAEPAAIMEEINTSVDVDRRLWPEDIAGSLAHCEMLVAQGIVEAADGQAIMEGLRQVAGEIEEGSFTFRRSLEDVHMNIEARLHEIIGEPAGRLHTARSRNDQVATDFRLWVRNALDRTDAALVEMQAALIKRAEENADVVLPGLTHLQAAQPVTFGHHLLAYVEMFGRDRGRVRDCRSRLNECPLGAAALAGTSFPIDRERTALALGFDRPAANSMDAVSDRDFAIEFLALAAICITHLSRLAEEIVLWTSEGFRFVSLSDAFSTGSSILPQKRNPDAAELVRGKAGRVLGSLLALLTVVKGLPLTYSKDLQEDKEPVFDTADTLVLCLKAMSGMICDLSVHGQAMREAAASGFLTATDLADWMVRTLNLSFRRAHEVTGSLVKIAEAKGARLEDLTLEDLQSVEPRLNREALSVLDIDHSTASRTSLGGTAPDNVRRAVVQAREKYL
jgi:argininosuccinate lyase